MYVRIIRGQTQPGQVDELARRWQEVIAPRLQGVPGFRRVYFCGDRGANRVAAVSVWDSRPDEAALDRGVQEFRERVRDISAGEPVIEGYEVLAEA